MKKTVLLIGAILAFLLVSCATNKVQENAVSGTVFDYAFDGVPFSHKDFIGKGEGYFVDGPKEALGPDAKDGWKRRSLAGLNQKGDCVYMIEFLENDDTSVIGDIYINKRNSDLFLSHYIGKKKAAVLRDFPLGAGIDDREYRDELRYDAENMTIHFFLKGKTVVQIRIKPKKKADIGKRYLKIAADWWAEQAAESESEIVDDEPSKKSGWWE